MEENSLGMIDLTHSTNLEHPCELVKGSSQLVALNSSNSLEQASTFGRSAFPIGTIVSPGSAKDPLFDEISVLQLILSPIVSHEEMLRQDKSKMQALTSTSNFKAACFKDGKTLHKFWGDDDTDTTDLEQDTDKDSQRITSKDPQPDFYLVSASGKVKTGKRGRPKKQKSPSSTIGGSKHHHTTSKPTKETVLTRSQASSNSLLQLNISL